MAKAYRDGFTAFRVRPGALAATDPARVLFEGEFFDAPPASGDGLINVWSGSAWVAKPVKVWTGSAWAQKPLKFWDGTQWRTMGGAAPASPAAWFTPSSSFVVTPSSPPQYYQATLAWSYRHDPGEINYPRVTNRMLDSDQGTWIEPQDGDDTAGRQFVSQVISWGWDAAYLTGLVSGFLKPSQTHNFVMLFDTAGGLSGGNTVQIWCNGTMVMSSSHAWADFSLHTMRLMGNTAGTLVFSGETQGFWFSGDTAIAPSTVFADLFDGTNGMLDLASPVIDGVTPDAYQFGP